MPDFFSDQKKHEASDPLDFKFPKITLLGLTVAFGLATPDVNQK
jgi:hypothetical protein